ncbi:class I SAM-dependent methyltransferase [Treponema brennaborense]|uniref:Methyltransferase domain-containing protein n=1 Tax=Treponema brennaborense (strain DSM 12168 / CIP 105900 / DD5/3) TaxID=906968 RepID=F4LM88_TREBD|nr:class I SAM-dependent methyltransferase [Treponema brennaborense]AEE17754.1 hypothetical protein Trebr_2345 [Treponema brennaborense DSM 12168]
MEFMQNILEYYDELFPVAPVQKEFYLQLLQTFQTPPKLLSIYCGSGSFEQVLARSGYDVTGIDTSPVLLESANRKRRMPGTSIRFFQMSTLEMTRFLGKSFYSVISCLNGRAAFIHDTTLLRKFFFDCRSLLTPGGALILQLPNYDYFSAEPSVELPAVESIRSKLHTRLVTQDDGSKYIVQQVETSSGRLVTIADREPVFPLTESRIREFAASVGFSHVTCWSGFDKQPFAPDLSPFLVCELR